MTLVGRARAPRRVLAAASVATAFVCVGMIASRPSVAPVDVPPSAAQTPDAAAFLDAMRGTPVVACELVVQALANRRAEASVRPRLSVPGGLQTAERDLVEWVGTGRLGAENTTPLLGALASDDACVRRVGARLLPLVDDPTVPQRLAEQLTRPDPVVRLATIVALSYVRTQTSMQALAGVLDGNDPESRRAAAWAMAGPGAQSETAALAAALRDTDPLLRGNAAWALGRIRAQTTVPALVSALDDDVADVRLNAAWALGQLANAEAVPALVRALTSDSSQQVRTAAAWALGRIDAGAPTER